VKFFACFQPCNPNFAIRSKPPLLAIQPSQPKPGPVEALQPGGACCCPRTRLAERQQQRFTPGETTLALSHLQGRWMMSSGPGFGLVPFFCSTKQPSPARPSPALCSLQPPQGKPILITSRTCWSEFQFDHSSLIQDTAATRLGTELEN
jgi:hypothetical protein